MGPVRTFAPHAIDIIATTIAAAVTVADLTGTVTVS
jgi:hypothetical protein